MPQSSHMEDAVRFVIDRELYSQGFTRADLARELGIPNSTMKRRMDGAGPGGALDALVAAASEIVGLPPLALWAEALALWKRAPDEDYWPKLRRARARFVAGKDRQPNCELE